MKNQKVVIMQQQLTVLTFQRGEERAFVVTNGKVHRIFFEREIKDLSQRDEFTKLGRCISFLETRGFSVCAEETRDYFVSL